MRAFYNDNLKRPLHMFMAFAVIICTVFCIPSFAYTYPPVSPFTSVLSTTLPSEGVSLEVSPSLTTYIYTYSYNYIYYVGMADSSTGRAYVAYVKIPETNWPEKCQAYIISDTLNCRLLCGQFEIQSNNNVVLNNNLYVSNLDSNTGLYYVSAPGTNNREDAYYSVAFDNFDSMMTAASSFISGGGGGDTETVWPSTPIEVPKGTVLYIGVPANGTLTMSGKTMFPVDSKLFSSVPWPDAPQRVKQVASRPQTGDTLEGLEAGAMPNWRKQTDYQSIVGQTNLGEFGPSTWSFENAGFLRVYNPFYYGTSGTYNIGGSSFVDNNSLFLNVSGYTSLRLYPIRDSISDSGPIGTLSDADNNWDATITDDDNDPSTPPSVTWSASNSDMPEQPESILNSTSGVASITEYIQQINETLSNFANSFINLLKAPVEHIAQLVNAGSDFVSHLSGLYTWLPVDVYSTLTSGIILCIVIGVLKVLL